MKYRAVANGNILDARDVPEGLIAAGIYVLVQERAPEPETPVLPPQRESALHAPEAPLLTAAHTSPPAPRSGRAKGRRG